MSDFWAWIIGGICFVAMMFFVVNFSYERWHEDSHPLTHEAGWLKREGTVISQQEPDFNDSPPDRNSLISFPDYYGKVIKASVRLPYPPVQQVRVDVSKDGTIYVPADINNCCNDWADTTPPFRRGSNIWPWGGIILGGILAAIIAWGIGGIAFKIPSTRGRLGTR